MSEIGRIAPAVPGQTTPASPAPATPAPATPAPATPAPATPAPASNTPATPTPAGGANTILQSDNDTVRTSDVARAARDGATVQAQVVARDGNAFVLRSQSGTAFVITANPTLAAVLAQGSNVRLAVLPGSPPSVSLLAANGITLQPPLSALLQNPTPTQLALAVPQVGQAASALLPNPGQTLAGTVLPSNMPATPQAGQAGAQAAIRAAEPGTLPPGSAVQMVVRAVAAPGAMLPQSAQQDAAGQSTLPAALAGQAAGKAGLLAGVVTGQNATGQVLLRTPQGMLALDLPQAQALALAPGSQLALELTSLARPAAPVVTQLAPLPAAGILQRLQGGWPAMQNVLDALRASNPDLAAKLSQALPQANARLAANALQFMAASAIGNAQAWLGAEASKALKDAGKGDLLAKLDDDFRDLGKLNQRGGDTDWQALTLPMLVQGRVEPVQVFMRRRRDRRKNQTQSRFILDFNLESTGPVQFDGYMADKRLDLVLRSLTEFGPAFKLDVQRIFDDAMAITGMTGALRFHDREPPIPWPTEPGLEIGAGPHQSVEV